MMFNHFVSSSQVKVYPKQTEYGTMLKFRRDFISFLRTSIKK